MIARRSFVVILFLNIVLIYGIGLSLVHAEEGMTIGAILGISGPPPIAAGSKLLDLGLKDCVAMANEQGGINGKKITYVVKDDKYNAELGASILQDLMAEHKPLCVFGSGTPLSLAVAPVIRDRYKVLYSSPSFSGKLAQAAMFPSTFVVGPTYSDQVAIALKYIAKSNRQARVAFLYSDTAMGKDPIAYGRIICRRLQLKLVGEAIGDIRGGDHYKQIEELKGLNPDFVVMHGWVGAPAADVITQCRDLGLNSTIIITLWGVQKSVLDKMGPDGPSFLGLSPFAYWWMTDVPMIQKLREYTAKRYPDVKYRSLSYIVSFTAGLIFVECMKKADKKGKLNSTDLLKALRSLKDFDTGGLTPPLTIRNNRFPISQILKAVPAKGIFEPAPLPEGLEKWIRGDS